MADVAWLRLAWLVAAWLLAVVSPGAAASGVAQMSALSGPRLAVPPHEAIYHASVRGIPVRAGLRLEKQDDGLFLYKSWVEPRGMFSFISKELVETSLLQLDAAGAIVPISYRKRDEIGGRDSDMRFDRAAGRLHVDYRGEQTTTDWEPGIYDLLSLRLVIANDLARGELQEVYRVVDDRSRVEVVDVEVAGRERLSTPVGEFDTVRLEYRSRRRDKLFRLWIAPDQDATLVRLEQVEDGRLRGRLNIVEYRRL